MNPIHFHLLITHLPVFASLTGALLLIFGRIRDSRPTREAAYALLILSGFGTFASNFSGERAEHLVEEIPGVLENLIEEHEESVGFVFWTLIPAALASVVAFWSTRKNPALENRFSTLAIGLALLGFVAVARTAWLGGQIRHSEIHTNSKESPIVQNESEEESEDAD